MKNFAAVKEQFIIQHNRKDLVDTKRRINALEAIEALVKQKSPLLLSGGQIFEKYDRFSFEGQYLKWKNRPLSGAEKSVIKSLFDLAGI